MLDVNTFLATKAGSSSPSDSSQFAFQAQAIYILGGQRLDKCLLGAVNYTNPFVRITLAHKLEDWLFCTEQNLITNEGVYVGAFYRDRHYTFSRLCNVETNIKEVAFKFQQWIFHEVIGLFYLEGLAMTLTTKAGRIKPVPLKEKRVVPNDQAASRFLAENPDVLPVTTQ